MSDLSPVGLIFILIVGIWLLNSIKILREYERGVIRLSRAGDFLRRDASTQREAADAFGVEKKLENREAELVRIVGRRGQQYLARVARRASKAANLA